MGEESRHEEGCTSVRKIKFRGDEAKWRSWKAKTETLAFRQGFLEALLEEEVLPTRKSMDDETATKAELKAYRRNVEAYTYLSMSCEGNVETLINNSKSTRAKYGDARLAWIKLVQTYESDDVESDYARMHGEFTKCTLQASNNDIFKWLYELEYWNNRMGTFG